MSRYPIQTFIELEFRDIRIMTKTLSQKARARSQGKPKRGPLRVTYNMKNGGSSSRMIIPRPPRIPRGRAMPVRGINRIDMPPVGIMSAAPVALSRNVKSGRPMRIYQTNGDCIISHREYIQDITASTGNPSIFSVTGFAINPGQSAVFPWLSGVASRFESYCFEQLRFEYETEAPSTLGGSVILTVDYDAADLAPATKQVAMSYADAVRSAPWEPSEHTSKIESLTKQKTYFVRPAGLPAGNDIKTYDTGNLFVVTQGVTTASATCGELYVTYRVKLMTPLFDQTALGSGTIFGKSGLSSAALFGTTQTITGGIVITVNAAGSIFTCTGFIIGQEYAIYQYVTGTVIAVGAGLTFTGATDISNIASTLSAAATSAIFIATFIATATTVVVTSGLTATTVASDYIVIALIGPNPGF